MSGRIEKDVQSWFTTNALAFFSVVAIIHKSIHNEGANIEKYILDSIRELRKDKDIIDILICSYIDL